MSAYIFDAIILVILVFFAWRGAKKGLILSLCGLLGLFVAFWGAQLISNQFYRPVADIMEPAIYQTIRGAEPEHDTPQDSPTIDSDSMPDEMEPTYTLEELLSSMQEKGVFTGLRFFLQQAAQHSDIPAEGGRTVASALSGYLSHILAKAALFALSFAVLLLVWFLVSRILDLAFRLPILSTVNTFGGLLLGLIKAVLVVFVLVWLGQLSNVIPQNPTTPILPLFMPNWLGSFLDQLLI